MRLLQVLCVFCFLLVSANCLGQQCQQGNNPSLLSGYFTIRFDATIPVPVPQSRVVVMKAVSILGQVVYDGRGNMSISYNGYITVAPGKTQLFVSSGTHTVNGTYCAYPNSWVNASLSDGSAETWNLNSIHTSNGELETVLSHTQWGLTYSSTFTQKFIRNL